MINYGDFVCGECGETFPQKRSPEELITHAIANWGEVPEDSMLVCDPCFEKIMASEPVFWPPVEAAGRPSVRLN